jgi:uncharacterized protein YbjT (DUF2867 family)
MQLLVTGATGKVGVNLIERLLSDPRWRLARVRALGSVANLAGGGIPGIWTPVG